MRDVMMIEDKWVMRMRKRIVYGSRIMSRNSGNNTPPLSTPS